MSAQVIHDNSGATAPSLEIEKLKTLVHNLESQNSALRAKGFAGPAVSVHGAVENGTGTMAAEKHVSSPRLLDGGGASSWLDAIPLLDVDGDSSLEEESSWLYVSPSKYTSACSSSSPYKWMRQDFDEPSANTKLARRSLVFTLDDVINDRSVSKVSIPSAAPATAVVSAERFASPTVGINQELSGRGTFKAYSPARVGEAANVATSASSSNAGSASNRSPPAVAAVDSVGRGEAAAAGDRAASSRSPEMLDIQAMARLQEQSLRESFNSLRRASGSSSGSIPQLNLSDLDSSTGSSMSGSARQQEGSVPVRGSMDTYRVEKGTGGSTAAAQQPQLPQPATNGFVRPALPTLQPGGQSSHSDSGNGSPGNAAAVPPSTLVVRKGGLPVPTLRPAASAAPRSRDPSPLPQPGLSTTASPRPVLQQPSALPRASNLPTLGSRRSGVPTPRSSAAAAIARPSD